ncbi:LAMI_0B06700g1_1 [Lachancea mirantina]|uniref:DNA 3'-5' helicase n=1 Tax=Lachancea mirantina TaxID=1230905 RepID=A0A1G4IXC7_9SACH|nr:LAMI_0B06700g1_1 [Lachancea mirantina]
MFELSSSQCAVIQHPYSPGSTLKVVAGPGSGKTHTLLLQIRQLIAKGSVQPDEILVLSLTNKAVDNIIDKLLDAFQNDPHDTKNEVQINEVVSKIAVFTIHGLASRIVTENEGIVNIIEEDGWRGLLKLIPPDLHLGQCQLGGKNSILRPRELERIVRDYQTRRTAINKTSFMESLMAILRDSKVVTNDDLILSATNYLHVKSEQDPVSNEGITNDVLSKYKVVIIDEFQDLYPSLTPLIQKVAQNKELILFGDPNQSIYGFLGNNKLVMKSLESARPSSSFETLSLPDSYRCTPEIKSLAETMTGTRTLANPKSTSFMHSKPPCGIAPFFVNISDPVEELEWIVDQIAQLVCCSAKLSDIAILTRTNVQAKSVSEFLRSYGIPFEVLNSQPAWIEDKHIKFLIDLLRFCTLISDETNDQSPLTQHRTDFSSVIVLSSLRGIGSQTVQTLFNQSSRMKCSIWNLISNTPESEWRLTPSQRKKIKCVVKTMQFAAHSTQSATMTPLELVSELIGIAQEIGYSFEDSKQREQKVQLRERIIQMVKVIKLCENSKPEGTSLPKWFLATYFDQGIICHRQDKEAKNKQAGIVKISTIHSSKGLEFPIVFLMGEANSKLPLEKKVIYVGMTRARNLLYINNLRQANQKSVSLISPLEFGEPFWRYYNHDLDRHWKADKNQGLTKYNLLRKTYGLSTLQRTFSTLRSCIRKF